MYCLCFFCALTTCVYRVLCGIWCVMCNACILIIYIYIYNVCVCVCVCAGQPIGVYWKWPTCLLSCSTLRRRQESLRRCVTEIYRLGPAVILYLFPPPSLISSSLPPPPPPPSPLPPPSLLSSSPSPPPSLPPSLPPSPPPPSLPPPPLPTQVGRNSLENNLLRYSAKDHFFKASICWFCIGVEDVTVRERACVTCVCVCVCACACARVRVCVSGDIALLGSLPCSVPIHVLMKEGRKKQARSNK